MKAVTDQAQRVLATNDRGNWTVPTAGLYPHQWLWDSCFIAIGLAHSKPARAAQELESLLRGQWKDRFLPHIIYGPSEDLATAALWRGVDPAVGPPGIYTSAITQPPMVAVATERVALSLTLADRQAFLTKLVPAIIRYHLWLYRYRRPANGSGLVGLVHPWESGMDDSPPWIEAIHQHPSFSVPEFLRSDLKYARSDERPTGYEDAQLLGAALALDHFRDPVKALDHLPVMVGDIVFNSILAWNDEALERIAQLAGVKLPEELTLAVRQTVRGIAAQWDETDRQFYHYDLRQGRPIKVPSVATLLPLLTSAPEAEQIDQLLKLMADPIKFGLPHPAPTIPADSPDFEPNRYWHGPTWTNINWLIIQGLLRHGRTTEATTLRAKTLELVETVGCREYFSPKTGEGLGAKDFSWTAALYLDLTATT